MNERVAPALLRSRELRVPRYNEFRRLLHLEPAKDFHALTDNSRWAEELSRIYGGDIEKVDVMPRMHAGRRPKGFAVRVTAPQQRPVLHRRYTQEVYTKDELEWIEDNTMMSVLGRHYPHLAGPLRSVENGFHPWKHHRRVTVRP